MPDLANMAAQASSMETVPIIITTSRMRSSSAEPETHERPKRAVNDVFSVSLILSLMFGFLPFVEM